MVVPANQEFCIVQNSTDGVLGAATTVVTNFRATRCNLFANRLHTPLGFVNANSHVFIVSGTQRQPFLNDHIPTKRYGRIPSRFLCQGHCCFCVMGNVFSISVAQARLDATKLCMRNAAHRQCPTVKMPKTLRFGSVQLQLERITWQRLGRFVKLTKMLKRRRE